MYGKLVAKVKGFTKTIALTAVGNKIPDYSFFSQKKAKQNKKIKNKAIKTDYNTKTTETEKKLTDHNYDKYITTPEFNKFIAEVLDSRLARANLATKADFDTKLIKSKN